MAFGLTKSADLVPGSSQYADISNASQTGLGITGNFTLEAWIKTDANTTAQEIINKADTGSGGFQGYVMRLSSANKLVGFTLGNTPDLGTVVGDTTLSAGTWYHVAIVYDGSTIEPFVNGASDKTGVSTTVDPTTNTNSFKIGSRNDVAQFFDGHVSLVRVWSVARTEAELNNNKCNVLGSTAGLEGEWTLDDVLTDGSGNGNTLTNQGSFSFVADVNSVCGVTFIPSITMI